MRNKFVAVFLVFSLIFAVSCNEKKQATVDKKKVYPVSAYIVKKNKFVLSEERDGEVVPYDRVYLVPTVQGTLIEMKKKIGDKVKKGELVAVVDHRVIEDKLKALKNQIGVAKAKRLLLEKDVDRFKRLYAKDAVSKHKLEEVEADYNATKSQEEAFESQYNALKERLKDYFVKSPINGVVTDKLFDVGNVVAGKPIYIIDNLRKVKIQTNVGEDTFNKLNPNSYLIVSIPSINKTFKAKIQRKSASVDYLTRSGKVECVIDNNGGLIKPGMYIKVKVVAFEYEGLAVIRDALMRIPATGVFYVFKINKDNTVQKVNLKLGRINGDYQEVLDGLKAGDRVVVKGQGILKTGYKVDVKEIDKL